MPRVTSSKTRKMMFVVGEALELGFTPEHLELYLPNGTPMDLSKDATRMLWRGEWANDQYYEQNDVVIDAGDLFILKAPTIGIGGISPSEENAVSVVTVEFPGSGGGTAYPLIDGERSVDPYSGIAFAFFDLVVGGTITITDELLPTEFIELFDSTGTGLVTNWAGSGAPFGLPLVAPDLPAGRYFVRWQEAVALIPGPMQLQVVRSDGAQFTVLIKSWDVLFRASSGPTGPAGPEGPEGPIGPPGAEGGAAGILEAWEGDWTAIDYLAGVLVRHSSGLYVALADAVASSEPGAPPEDEMASMSGAWAGDGPYSVPRSTGAERAFVGSGTISETSTVFFDVTSAGTVIVNQSASGQVIRLTSTGNYAAEHTGTSWDMGSLAVGRYFLAFRTGTGTFTLDGTAELGPNAGNPWQLMVQGA